MLRWYPLITILLASSWMIYASESVPGHLTIPCLEAVDFAGVNKITGKAISDYSFSAKLELSSRLYSNIFSYRAVAGPGMQEGGGRQYEKNGFYLGVVIDEFSVKNTLAIATNPHYTFPVILIRKGDVVFAISSWGFCDPNATGELRNEIEKARSVMVTRAMAILRDHIDSMSNKEAQQSPAGDVLKAAPEE